MNAENVCIVWLVLAALTPLITVSAEDRCCGPKEWTAQVNQVFGEYQLTQDFYTLNEILITMYYDFSSGRVAFDQIVVNETGPLGTTHSSYNQGPTRVRQILDYKVHKKWVIINEKKCTESELKEDMPGPCIPDSAELISSQMLINEPVNIWFVEKVNMTSTRATYTQKDCLPVSSSVMAGSPQTGYDYSMTVSLYQNVTAWHFDPKVFNLPECCMKHNLVDMIDFVAATPPIPWL